jgi:hypothetical protein
MPQTRADAIRRICEDLGLPAGDRFTQDWEYELPEEFRTSAWVQRFIIAYNSQRYGTSEKQVLMTLLLDCLNDGIEAGDAAIERLWNDVAALLLADRDIHSNLIEHWRLSEESLEDAFAITARIRSLRS